jgi:hypothetical protein
MPKETVGQLLLRLLKIVALIDLAAFGLVGLICLIGGWLTVYAYGTGLVYASMFMLGIGALSVFGVWFSHGDQVQEAPTTDRPTFAVRLGRFLFEMIKSYAPLFTLFTAAIIPAVLGTLIQIKFQP